MLSVMRDETADTSVRLDAAKAAAPYDHPRLTTIEPPRTDQEVRPLVERLRSYLREDTTRARKAVEATTQKEFISRCAGTGESLPRKILPGSDLSPPLVPKGHR